MERFVDQRAGTRALFIILVLTLAGCGSESGSTAGSGGSAGAGASGGSAGIGGAGGMAGTGGDGGAGGIAGSGGSAGAGGAGGSGGSGGTAGTGGPEPSGPTSIDAIEDAFLAGEIDDIDALRFKVFAVFGDERLPQAYRSEAPLQDGTRVLLELSLRVDALPTNVQAEMDPFLRPPADPLSWYQLRQTASELAPKAHNPLFDHIDAVDGEALIHWPVANAALQTEAGMVAAALSGPGGVWAKLTTLMGREPLRDDGIIESYNGGDGRYDVYVIEDVNVTTTSLRTAFGWTAPYRDGRSGNAITTYLVMNRDRIATSSAGLATKIKSNVAHEFMHVLQFAHDVSSSWDDYYWLMESTSTWAEDFVFPLDDIEHEDSGDYLRRPDFTLSSEAGNHEYGAYLYWFFLTKQPGGDPSLIADVWGLTESQSSLDAANAVSPGGFKAAFADFAVANWNQAPFNNAGNAPYDAYRIDRMTDVADVTPERPMANPEDDVVVSFDRAGGGVVRLSAKYVHYRFSNANSRSLLFANGYTFRLAEGTPPDFPDATGDRILYATPMQANDRAGRRVLALIKQNGTWQPDPFDLTNVAFAPFCQEVTSESLEELVLIFINTEHRDNRPFFAIPQGLAPRLFATNVGCGAWIGTAGARASTVQGGDVETTIMDISTVEFTREGLTLEQIAAGRGQVPFAGTIYPPRSLPGLSLMQGGYELTKVSGTWEFSESYGPPGGTMCSGSGSGILTLNNVFAASFDVAPHLRGTIPGDLPSLYRSFLVGVSFRTEDEPISGQCVSNGMVTPYTKTFFGGMAGGYRNTAEFGPLLIEPSGDRINASWSMAETDVDLDVSSAQIP